MTPDIHLDAERAMQVITRDGRQIKGGRAVLFVLEQAGWHPRLIRLAAKRPFVWIVDGVYRIVADHRQFFSRLFFKGTR